MLARVWLVALALAFVASGDDAHSWDAPAGCPDADDVERRIAGLAGRVGTDRELRVRARVVGPPWVVQLELGRDGVQATRTFTAQTCDELADIVAVVVAVALDPVGVAVRVETVASAPAISPEPAEVPRPLLPRRDSPSTTNAVPTSPTPSRSQLSARRQRSTAVARVRSIARVRRAGQSAGQARATRVVSLTRWA